LAGGEGERDGVAQGNQFEMELQEDSLQGQSAAYFTFHDFPYKNQVPTQILERWRWLSTITLDTTNTHVMIDPFSLLMNELGVKAALTTFLFFRADLEIEITNTTTPFIYGSAFVVHAPWLMTDPGQAGERESWFDNADPTFAGGTGWRRLLSYNPAIIDVAKQNSVKMLMKWSSPAQYVNLNEYLDNTNPSHAAATRGMGGMYKVIIFRNDFLFVVNSAQQASVDFQIHARFVNVQTQGFVSNVQDSVTPPFYEAECHSGKEGWSFSVSDIIGAHHNVNQGIEDISNGIRDTFESNSGMVSVAAEGDRNDRDLAPSKLSNVPDMFGDLVAKSSPARVLLPDVPHSTNRNSMMSLIRKSNFIGLSDFSQVTILDETIYQAWPIDHNRLDRISFLSQFFRFWRGSLIFSFCFFYFAVYIGEVHNKSWMDVYVE